MREQLKETLIPNFLRKTSEYDVSEIENAIISEYLHEKLDSNISTIIKDMQIEIDIETLTYLFEALLDSQDVNENGIVFTPEYIASFICENVFSEIDEWNENYRIIDPGCGCGIFLVSAVLYINKKYSVPIDNIIKNNIYGLDLIPENVYRCKKVLSALAKRNGILIDDKSINIYCADSLKEDWNEIFNVGGFDFIIGNPPYVNTHDMTKETALFLKKTFSTTKSGVYNIFYAFIERGMDYLNKAGKLSFIIPNNFLTIKSATDLRAFIQKNKHMVSVLDFADNMVFKPVRTYNCIIVLDKNNNDKFKYSVMEKTDNIQQALTDICYDEMPLEHLDKAGWKLVDHATYLNLEKIENQFKPIKDFIRTGIATLRDEVFMVCHEGDKFYKEVDGEIYDIEKGIVKALYKIPELKNCTNLIEVCRYIIFPYVQGNNGYEIIPEEDFRTQYPNAYRYLTKMRSELDERDKGKPNPVAWYAYGRTQGLNKFGRKLLFPTFADIPKFLLVEDENALFCNGYGVFENDYLELDELRPILNSKIMRYYVSNTSYSIEGGYYCYQKKYIERFSLPWFTEDEKEILRSGNNEQVDDLLADKYGIAIWSYVKI